MIRAAEVFERRVSWQTKFVLLALLEECGWQEEFYPAVDRLARKTGLPVETVERCLEELRAAGALLPVGRSNGARCPRSHRGGRLRVDLAALPRQAPFRGRKFTGAARRFSAREVPA